MMFVFRLKAHVISIFSSMARNIQQTKRFVCLPSLPLYFSQFYFHCIAVSFFGSVLCFNNVHIFILYGWHIAIGISYRRMCNFVVCWCIRIYSVISCGLFSCCIFFVFIFRCIQSISNTDTKATCKRNSECMCAACRYNRSIQYTTITTTKRRRLWRE